MHCRATLEANRKIRNNLVSELNKIPNPLKEMILGSWEVIRRYFQKRGKKALLKQLHDIIKCTARYRSMPMQYLFYDLYDQGVSHKEMLLYVNDWIIDRGLRVRPHANKDNHFLLLDSKILFKQIMSLHQILVPKTIIYVINRTFYDSSSTIISVSDALTTLQSSSSKRIFLKFDRGKQAKNIVCLEKDQHSGKLRYGETFANFSFLNNLCQNGNYLFEENIVQHPILSKIYPCSVNSFRTITHFVPSKGAIVLFCTLRIGRGRSVYDNLSTGGLCIRVDLGTAELDSVAFDYFGNKYTEHPDTGFVFAGQKIPFLKDMISVCIKAANSLPSIPSIGWDVSCGENGPIIIEANYRWGLRTIQYPNGGIADIIYDRLGIRL